MRPIHDQYTDHAQSHISTYHKQTIEELKTLIAQHDVVVVGMFLNPYVSKVKRSLKNHKIVFHYQEYGGYFSAWKQRLAIKLWSGWPTFPQVFVRKHLIGGAEDTIMALESGELQQRLQYE